MLKYAVVALVGVPSGTSRSEDKPQTLQRLLSLAQIDDPFTSHHHDTARNLRNFLNLAYDSNALDEVAMAMMQHNAEFAKNNESIPVMDVKHSDQEPKPVVADAKPKESEKPDFHQTIPILSPEIDHSEQTEEPKKAKSASDSKEKKRQTKEKTAFKKKSESKKDHKESKTDSKPKQDESKKESV